MTYGMTNINYDMQYTGIYEEHVLGLLMVKYDIYHDQHKLCYLISINELIQGPCWISMIIYHDQCKLIIQYTGIY